MKPKIKSILSFAKNVKIEKRALDVYYHIDREALVLFDGKWIKDPDQLVVVTDMILVEGHRPPNFYCTTDGELTIPTDRELWEGLFKYADMWFPKHPAVKITTYN